MLLGWQDWQQLHVSVLRVDWPRIVAFDESGDARFKTGALSGFQLLCIVSASVQ